ncbi:MAG: hypothetical protein BRD37_06405, partial [Bacteroidetes bacterium QH_8_67_23]
MKRRTVLFAGLGLVLVGLLTGILGTLLFSNAAAPAQQFVRRVELSGAPLPGSTAAPVGSTAAPGSTAAVGGSGRLNERFERVASRVRPSVVFLQIQTGAQVLPGGALPGSGRGGGGDEEENGGGGERRRFFGPRKSVGSGV